MSTETQFLPRVSIDYKECINLNFIYRFFGPEVFKEKKKENKRKLLVCKKSAQKNKVEIAQISCTAAVI